MQLGRLTAMAATLLLAAPALAQTFDFETVPVGAYAGQLVVAEGGQTLTVTPEGSPNGWVIVTDAVAMPLLGARSVVGSRTPDLRLDGFAPLRFTFAFPVDEVTFAFGDLGGDTDSPVVIEAYDATGALLGIHVDTYPDGYSAGKTATLAYDNAKYFIAKSLPGWNNHSLGWDILRSRVARNEVPEPDPALALLIGGGTVGLLLVRRRR